MEAARKGGGQRAFAKAGTQRRCTETVDNVLLRDDRLAGGELVSEKQGGVLRRCMQRRVVPGGNAWRECER